MNISDKGNLSGPLCSKGLAVKLVTLSPLYGQPLSPVDGTIQKLSYPAPHILLRSASIEHYWKEWNPKGHFKRLFSNHPL